MKKIILAAAIAFGIFTVSSCRKERTCECKRTETRVRTGTNPGTAVANTSYKITKSKQKKKEFLYSESCFSQGFTYYENHGAYSINGTVEEKCELK